MHFPSLCHPSICIAVHRRHCSDFAGSQGVTELDTCGAAWLDADVDACSIPLPGDPLTYNAASRLSEDPSMCVPEIADVRWPPSPAHVPHLSLGEAAAVDLDSCLSGDSWNVFDATVRCLHSHKKTCDDMLLFMC